MRLFEQVDHPGICGYLNKWINLGYVAIDQVDQPGIYGYLTKWINLGYVNK